MDELASRVQETETSVTGVGGQLYARLWTAVGQPSRGTVVVVHGLGEHSGRYRVVAQRLAAGGWATLAYDQQGHGRSPGRRGCAASYDELLQDLEAAGRAARQQLGDGPRVLLGHSMGGNLAANAAIRDPSPWDALVLSGAFFLPTQPPPPWLLQVARVTAKLLPFVPLRAPVVADQLTRDPEELRTVATDPLRHRWMSLPLITQLLARGRWALEHADQLRLPALVLCGDDDPLADPAGSEAFAAKSGSPACLHRYAGMLHEPFHEVDREQVFRDVLHWLQGLGEA